MRAKRYVEGGSIFTNTGNRQQPNVNMPQAGIAGQTQSQPGQLPQPGQSSQPSAGGATPYPPVFTSGVQPNRQTLDINVGGPSSAAPPQSAGQMFRKGGYVKAADGIASKGKTRGRMC